VTQLAEAAATTTEIAELGRRARAASLALTRTTAGQRREGLLEAASAIRAASSLILDANARDCAAATGLTDASRDRLVLDAKRVAAMADGVEVVAKLPDPLDIELARWTQPNGLDIARISVPLGVIGIIYESRPNVTADAGSLCLKSGNAVILRGGSESFLSSAAIVAALRAGIAKAGLPVDAIQSVPTRDRQAVGQMLKLSDYIDVIVPRGGRSLIARVMDEARMPVMAHLDGNCHIYIHAAADLGKTRSIVLNAKLRRTGVCGAVEGLVVDRSVVQTHLKPVLDDLIAGGCEIRGDAATRALDARVLEATEEDWSTEYLDAIISVKVVDGVEAAIAHINTYGSHHTDAILTEDEAAASLFTTGVDSAIVLVNASTQFADGGEFGFGGEIGISTGKLHARGPVGAAQLTSYKYIVRGTGQVRP
jgi:glutamate-5-semialdehyde dehydrogenase